MHLLSLRTKFLSKFSIFVLVFVLAIFSNAAMASDPLDSDKGSDTENLSVMDGTEDGDEDEQDIGSVDLASVISSTPPQELKTHLIKYRDNAGRNYLHLIRLDQFDLFTDTVGDDVVVGDLLLEYVKDSRSFDRFLSQEPINYRFTSLVTASRSDPDDTVLMAENDTVLMALAMRDPETTKKLTTLRMKGVDIDQEDVYGNTAESIDADWNKHDLPYFVVARNPNMARYRSQGFSNALWQDILMGQYPLYIRKLIGDQGDTLEPFDFASIAFETVATQHPQTGVHTAFLLMENSSNDVERVKANELWRGFFKAHDTLLSAEDAAQAQKLPLSGRILSVVADHQYNQDLPEATVQLITGTSRFGVKYRKATEDEAETYVWGIRKYVMQLLSNDSDSDFRTNVDHLKTALQRRPFKVVTEDKMHRLMRHHLKCTVVALYSLNEFDKGSATAPRAQKLNEDEIFDFIDGTLTGWPNEASINSKALFANVRGHLSADSEALDF
ncbi:MAG: hypothetical protein K2Q34_04070 [Alphaproteobacteria bacterium]|nr:hypothetical protein [Alphaproteobacteria bacterium]